MKPLRTRLHLRFVQQGGDCIWCGGQMQFPHKPRKFKNRPPRNTATVEHIIPLALGGADNVDNLVAACRSCNTKRGTRADFYPDERVLALLKTKTKGVSLMAKTRKGDWMQTYTGRVFWPLDPAPQDVCIEDIAHALSMSCRYNGHTRRFYSVAEHSVLVSRHVPPEDALWGLLHDATEAYLPDVIRPIKPHLTGFKEIENRLMDVICQRFQLSQGMPQSVHHADSAILTDEQMQVMGRPPRDWNLPYPGLGVQIRCWLPSDAEADFLSRFHELVMLRNKPAGEVS